MKEKVKNRTTGVLLVTAVVFAIGFMASAPALADSRLDLRPGETNWIPPKFGPGERAVITTQDLNAITVQQMVQTLLNLPQPGIQIQNWAFTGVPIAGGTFAGGTAGPTPNGPIGIAHGAILSSGNIASVRGGPAGACNRISSTSTHNGQPGDVDITAITGKTTWDRAILSFDIMSNAPRILVFRYVFGSEEHFEWEYTPYNDGYGVWITGPLGRLNYAIVPPPFPPPIFPWVGVTVDNINNGNPFMGAGPWANPFLFINNHCGVGGLGAFPCAAFNRETELDGLTQWGGPVAMPPPPPAVPLTTWPFPMAPNQWYTVEIKIADASDHVWDSDVFLKAHFGGACCYYDVDVWVCDDGVLEEDCAGEWYEGELCIDIDCPDPPVATGACCLVFPEVTCTQATEASCVAAEGFYAGDGTSCGYVGSCCLDGACIPMTYECCIAAGGMYSSGPCAPVGACELSPGVCIITTEYCCTGTYLGDGSECLAYGACCLEDGYCQEMTEADCEATGGEFLGDGTMCLGDSNENGIDDACEAHVPTVTEWGLIVLTVLLLAAGTIIFSRRQRRVTPA
ncbi:MAG: choice-of-anchor L domain-containing protein [Phycisphaerae bacterium]|nr:choice-of-anchor L domain-containing protein [Phycisphaerae bacterium]